MDIIDKRQHSQGTSVPNRIRFMDRARQSLRRVADEALQGNGIISDSLHGREVSISTDGIDEPFMRKSSSGGERRLIFTGNKDLLEGDRIKRPSRTSDEGSPASAGGAEELDTFRFVISRDEFLELLFEDCELPNLRKQNFGETDACVMRRAGFSKTGSPSQMDLIRTMRHSLGRRIALGRPKLETIEALERDIEAREARGETEGLDELYAELAQLRSQCFLIPFIEPNYDVRYRRYERSPVPVTQAVMFCLMDVSGSMTETMKGLAKRFYLLLELFLEKRYKRVEVVFIRHTDTAKEVDEETFFTSRESGGTIVSTALVEMLRVMHERYADGWNVYVAQTSDGDNISSDVSTVMELLVAILPLVQYYAYIEVGESSSQSTLWYPYAEIDAENFAMESVEHPNDIIRVFYRLFGRTQS